ncbi:hypothetical protein NHH03_01155 [Stieleria sp. TO1_6]|nr:hypothetical protein [Stieleria tagensis]
MTIHVPPKKPQAMQSTAKSVRYPAIDLPTIVSRSGLVMRSCPVSTLPGNRIRFSKSGTGRRSSFDCERQPVPADRAETNRSSRAFLFSPLIDLVFVANLYWPLLLLIDVMGGVSTHESLIFWQIYFITAPHRWITLILVAFDHQQTGDRRALFAMVAIAIAVGCLTLRWGTGTLLCLGVIDYVWNAWHFASQHHGIFRIYQRKTKPAGPAPETTGGATGTRVWGPRLEKLFFRGFLLYVIARVAGWGWSEGPFAGSERVVGLDWVALTVPVCLLGVELIRCRRSITTALGGLCYLTSMLTLFTAMLMAAHFERSQLVIQLALASAVFHSLEYMSIVTWSAQRKKNLTKQTVFSRLARTWMLFLVLFVVVIGVGNYLLSRGFFEIWVTINLIVAFWHYCFDGMIWKSRKPAPTPPLGVTTG